MTLLAELKEDWKAAWPPLVLALLIAVLGYTMMWRQMALASVRQTVCARADFDSFEWLSNKQGYCVDWDGEGRIVPYATIEAGDQTRGGD